jgi:hypothetical protein
MKTILKRLLKKTNWHNLRNLEPLSRVFALDRGTPIDRVYIEDFLEKNKKLVRGVTCEIADNTYSKKYGSNIEKFEILHYTNDNKDATIVGDLSNISTIPHDRVDCFILTQTLNFIYDFKSAIKGLHYMLKTGGVALVTVAGISQISRYDMDRWGDYWRFTDLSIKKAFEEVFGEGNVEVETYGNVLATTAFLQGISAEELTKDELFYQDKDYQMTITIKATKK